MTSASYLIISVSLLSFIGIFKQFVTSLFLDRLILVLMSSLDFMVLIFTQLPSCIADIRICLKPSHLTASIQDSCLCTFPAMNKCLITIDELKMHIFFPHYTRLKLLYGALNPCSELIKGREIILMLRQMCSSEKMQFWQNWQKGCIHISDCY